MENFGVEGNKNKIPNFQKRELYVGMYVKPQSTFSNSSVLHIANVVWDN